MKTIASKISWRNIMGNILLLVVAYFIVMCFFPLTCPSPFAKYNQYFWVFSSIWIFSGFVHWKYYNDYSSELRYSFRAFYSGIIAFGALFALCYFTHPAVSFFVLALVCVISFVLELLAIVLMFSFHRAHQEPWVEKDGQQVPHFEKAISYLSDREREFLSHYVALEERETNALAYDNAASILTFDEKPGFYCGRRFNKLSRPMLTLALINQKLPQDGLLVVHFETKVAQRLRILKVRPKLLGYLYYAYDQYKRFLHFFFLTAGLTRLLYGHVNRVYSTVEVQGRLMSQGFEMLDMKTIDNEKYIVCRKVTHPTFFKEHNPGWLIGLERIGKGGKTFVEYKMRTMYPYSEYLQGKIVRDNSLRDGGKIRRDYRITRFGRFARKCWIDELPQLVNLLKGDVKLVGVRPLSKQYFSLYSERLQRERIKYKPGMLPPFYADMPHTIEEIEASELRYLESCEKNGVIKTDFHYIWIIVKNILFKRAHSR